MPRTAKDGQIQKQSAAPGNNLAKLLQSMSGEIERALPKHLDPDRMLRIATTALRTTPKLAEVTDASFLGCILQAAQLGLEPNTPLQECYLIPRLNRKLNKQECTLIIGYQGLMSLARRNGQVTSIYAHCVHEGDTFSVSLGLHQDLEHIPSDDAERENRPVTHVYAVAHQKDGDPLFVVMSRAQIKKAREQSPSGVKNHGPWVTHWEEMAKKTAIRRLAKWLPRSAELAQAAAIDEAQEIGRAQATTFDPRVHEALEAQGMVIEAEQEEAPPGHEIDSKTGEVIPMAGASDQ